MTHQQIKVSQRDAVPHNVHTFEIRNSAFSQAIAPDRAIFFKRYGKAERVPFEVKCDFHPWERGVWLIVDHPFAAISNR